MKSFLRGFIFCGIVLISIYIYYETRYKPKNDKKEIVKKKIKPSVKKVVKKVETDTLDVIPFHRGNDGQIRIQARIGDTPMTFTWDSGCNGVQISIVEYLFLKRNAGLKDELEATTVTVASADTVEVGHIIVDSIKLGKNTVLTKVPISVSYNQNAPLLFGEDIMNKCAKIMIDNNKNQLIILK